MNTPAGCAQFGKYLALMLVGGLALAFGILSQGGMGLFSGNQSGNSSNGGIVRSTPDGFPRIPDAHFASGSATATVTGDMTAQMSLPTDKDKAYAQDGLAWFAFDLPGETNAILVTLDEPENSVAVSNGTQTAWATSDQCEVFTVSLELRVWVGMIRCAQGDLIVAGETVGQVNIKVDFSAK